VVRAWRGQTAEWIWLWVFPFVLTLGLALASTNLGTLARHRHLVVPGLAMLAAPIVIRLWDARPILRELPGTAPRMAAES
jgi:hypothetical protein